MNPVSHSLVLSSLFNIELDSVRPEKYRELEHNSTSLKSEKSLIENQLKILQQKYEIMTEMYQQKEISLQR